MAELSVPDQPDGIESESFDLPTPWDAANRVGEFLTWWGDGRIEPAVDSPEVLAVPPLFARDLQALINAQRAKADLSDHRLPAAEATLDHAEDRIADLLDDYGFARPGGLAEALDMLSTAFQVGAWLHEEALWVAHHESDLADQWCADLEQSEASRQAWAEEAMRQTSELNDYADLLLTCAESPSPEHLAKVLRRMAARRPVGCEFVADSGNACEEDAGHDGPHLRWFDEIRYEELAPSTVCACPPEGAVFPAPWTPPQCTVHPSGVLPEGEAP